MFRALFFQCDVTMSRPKQDMIFHNIYKNMMWNSDKPFADVEFWEPS